MEKARVFINFTNHPSDKWTEQQKEAALKLADLIYDVPFPNIDPEASPEFLLSLVDGIIKEWDPEGKHVWHVMGESGLVFALVSRLLDKGVKVVHSTTKRIVEEVDGKKISKFEFCMFREYRR